MSQSFPNWIFVKLADMSTFPTNYHPRLKMQLCTSFTSYKENKCVFYNSQKGSLPISPKLHVHRFCALIKPSKYYQFLVPKSPWVFCVFFLFVLFYVCLFCFVGMSSTNCMICQIYSNHFLSWKWMNKTPMNIKNDYMYVFIKLH